MNEQNIPYELLFKVLSGKASDEEANQLKQWKSASAENGKFFNDFSLIYAHAEKTPEHFRPDVNKALNKVHQKITVPEAKVRKMAPWPLFYKVAATIALILAPFIVWKWINSNYDRKTITYSTVKGEKKLVTLPDGTITGKKLCTYRVQH